MFTRNSILALLWYEELCTVHTYTLRENRAWLDLLDLMLDSSCGSVENLIF